METARLLLVDDDPQIVRALRATLTAQGYGVATAGSGEEALAAYAHERPDVLLLDLGLPGMDGLEVIRRLRATGSTPIVVLSARGEEGDKVRALELGADDYVTKPFGVAELLARISVALRHAGRTEESAVLRAGTIELDPVRRRVAVEGREVRLRPTEFELLRVFMSNPERVLTHRWLLERVWGPGYGTEGHYLHVYVAGLRKKLEREPHAPRHFITEPGVGYRFRSEPQLGE